MVSAVALPIVLTVVAIIYFATKKEEVIEISLYVQEDDDKEEKKEEKKEENKEEKKEE